MRTTAVTYLPFSLQPSQMPFGKFRTEDYVVLDFGAPEFHLLPFARHSHPSSVAASTACLKSFESNVEPI